MHIPTNGVTDMSKTNASTIPLGKRIAAGAIGAVLGLSMTIPFGATQAIAAESGTTGSTG